MLIFNQLELLPIAYFIILMCVVCSNVLAKLLGARLIGATSGSVKSLLAAEIHVPVTGDTIGYHLFEQQVIERINIRLWLDWGLDFTRWMLGELRKQCPTESSNPKTALYPQIYWSGCPPNVV
jgi:hypothetical protein